MKGENKMDREEVLKVMQEVHDELTYCKSELLADKEYKNAWKSKRDYIVKELKSLAQKDNKWVEQSFKAWAEKRT